MKDFYSRLFRLVNLGEEKWSGKVKVKVHPPEGLFASGSAEKIASWAQRSHDNLGSAIKAINFQKNRAGKNLSASRKATIERAIGILQKKLEKQKSKE